MTGIERVACGPIGEGKQRLPLSKGYDGACIHVYHLFMGRAIRTAAERAHGSIGFRMLELSIDTEYVVDLQARISVCKTLAT